MFLLLVVSCGSLSSPTNGSVTITEVTFGALANFTCDEGFNLIGSSSRQCQANGNWSGNDTSCESMLKNSDFIVIFDIFQLWIVVTWIALYLVVLIFN